MRRIADGLWQLRGFPPNAINVYLMDDVLVDAATRYAERPHLIGERQPDHFMAQLLHRTCTGPGHPVARRLAEGDEVGGFTVLDAPGHSAGHVAFWRESDRALVIGDVLNSADVFTGIPGLREPKPYFTPDPARNRESARRLAALEPAVVCFGHGPPLRDTRRLVDFVATLPE